MFRLPFPGRRQPLPPAAPAFPVLPDGRRVYAIGDIHGRLDLLNILLDKIRSDMGAAASRSRLVFLGDYIDRGAASKGVIERLLQPLPGNGAPVFLMGNHEQVLLSLFRKMDAGPGWLAYGGQATLLSYGISCPPGTPTPERLAQLQRNLIEKFPTTHRRFLITMPLFHVEGDYFFVHAGVRPERSLVQQDEMDLLWIRQGFLDYPKPLGKMIVHGHTISREVVFLPHRIGIDTGAYVSGNLTALVLEGATRRLIQTGEGSELIL